MAIIFPLKMTRMSKAQAQLIISLIWLVALLTPLPTALLSSLVPIPVANQTAAWNYTNQTIPRDPALDSNDVNSVNRDELSRNSVNSLDGFSDSADRPDGDVTVNREQPAEDVRYTCQEQWSDRTQRYYYSMTLMILQYFLPLTVLVYTYT